MVRFCRLDVIAGHRVVDVCVSAIVLLVLFIGFENLPV
jgi:hypothetical protein